MLEQQDRGIEPCTAACQRHDSIGVRHARVRLRKRCDEEEKSSRVENREQQQKSDDSQKKLHRRSSPGTQNITPGTSFVFGALVDLAQRGENGKTCCQKGDCRCSGGYESKPAKLARLEREGRKKGDCFNPDDFQSAHDEKSKCGRRSAGRAGEER